jgi:hypothetical protein
MESQQIVDYIRQQLAAGHTETRLRQHLLTNGWSQPAVEDAFQKYHKATDPKSSKPSLKARAKKLRRGGKLAKRTNGKWAKLGVAGVVVMALLIGGNVWYGRNKDLRPVNNIAKPLNYKQKQANDVNTVAGAVSQYSVDNGEIRSKLITTTDGSLTLCGFSCDNAAATIAPLMVYLASGVKIVPYQSGFMTTDKDTMYLIPGAKCADVHTLGGVNTNPRAIVIMYAQVNGRGVTPRCVTL